MGEYRLSEAFARTVRRRTLRVGLPLGCLAVLVGVGVSAAQTGSTAQFVVVLPFCAAVILVSAYRGYRRQVRQARSVVIAVSPETVTWRMAGVRERSIARADVLRIDEHDSGELTIVSRDPRQSLRIPAEIEEREELKRELGTFASIQRAGKVHATRWPAAAGVVTMLAFAITMVSTTKWVVATVGSALAVGLLACAWLIWRNRNLDARTRRAAWFVLLPVAAVIARVVAALRDA